jgi:hypothetical protein
MRHAPNLRTLKFKLPDPWTGVVYEDNNGHYHITGPLGARLFVIASDGLDWDHVSVSLPNRTPTWAEMVFIRSLFFRDDETVMQLSVPARDHVQLPPLLPALVASADVGDPSPARNPRRTGDRWHDLRGRRPLMSRAAIAEVEV